MSSEHQYYALTESIIDAAIDARLDDENEMERVKQARIQAATKIWNRALARLMAGKFTRKRISYETYNNIPAVQVNVRKIGMPSAFSMLDELIVIAHKFGLLVQPAMEYFGKISENELIIFRIRDVIEARNRANALTFAQRSPGDHE